MIIGITGTYCAGKGEVAELLKKKGFKYHSLSDMLREELKKRKIPITRDNLIELGNELREKQGFGVIADMLKIKLAWKKDYIVDSLRHPAEIESLQERKDFFLIKVDAPSKIRFARMKKRKRENDPLTFKEMLEHEKQESQTSGPGQQLGICGEMAEIVIMNNSTRILLRKKVAKLLTDLRKREKNNYIELKKIRPSWDEYFSQLTVEIGKRGTCNRGKAGCLIVKDRKIIATGYVGSPGGLPHCDEVGHQMKKILHEDGSVSQHCVRTIHAEQNAICQAARHGVSVDGATIYVNMTPCAVCARLIINSGIKKVVSNKLYHKGAESVEMFKQAKVELIHLSKEMQTYAKM